MKLPLADKCDCGFSLQDIKSNKRVNCENCYFYFDEFFKKLIFENHREEIYLLEKDAYKKKILFFLKLLDSQTYTKILDPNWKEDRNQIYNNQILDDISKWKIEPKRENWEISLRIRYSRNLRGIPYILENVEKLQLISFFFNRVFLFDTLKKHFESLSDGNEYHLFSHSLDFRKILSSKIFYAYLNFKIPLVIRIYVSEEDHFRIDFLQFLYKEDLSDSFIVQMVKEILKIYGFLLELDNLFFWQIHPHFGFLNQCPSNTGSGIRLYHKIKILSNEKIKVLSFYENNVFFKRLKNYNIRGSDGEFSKISDSLIIGFDLPYVEFKKFKTDLEKRLIFWLKEIHSIYFKK